MRVYVLGGGGLSRHSTAKQKHTINPLHTNQPNKHKHDNHKRVGVNRYNFLLESLADLDASLRARGSRLLVLRGAPEEALARAVRDWRATHLAFEADVEPYAVARDARVRAAAEAAGVAVDAPTSHTLYVSDCCRFRFAVCRLPLAPAACCPPLPCLCRFALFVCRRSSLCSQTKTQHNKTNANRTPPRSSPPTAGARR